MAIDTAALEAALEGALKPAAATPAAPAPVPEPAPAEAAPDVVEGEAAPDLAPDAPDALAAEGEEPAGPEPEFEIVYNGQPQKITGKEQITELLQKGMDYSQKSEYTNRLHETLIAQQKAQQEMSQFQQAIMGDLTEMQALQQRVAQWDQMNWSQIIDQDFTNAMKLQEQRNADRALLQKMEAQVNAKAQQFKQAKAGYDQQVLAAEQQALMAKLPVWRNSLKAQSEQTKIRSYLSAQGIQPGEIEGLVDHRYLLIARDAMLYRELMANRDAKVKQVRAAPPMVKPGAAQPNTGAIDPNKAKQAIVKLGKQGNTHAQEQLAVQLFQRAFK